MSGKIILTAQGFFSETVKNKFNVLTGDKTNKTIAFIVTAAKDKENNKFNLRDKDILLGMGFKSVDFIDLETTPDVNLSTYDVIYVCGGNSFKLLKFAKEANLKDSISSLLKRDGLYFGISSGSLILGPSIILANEVTPDQNDVGLIDLSGLEVVPYTIYPHYSAEVEEDLLSFEKRHGVKVQRLTNNQAIISTVGDLELEMILD